VPESDGERDENEQPGTGGAPRESDAEQADPESAPASDPPPGQEPGDGKQYDL
jgi:hypothetical protein